MCATNHRSWWVGIFLCPGAGVTHRIEKSQVQSPFGAKFLSSEFLRSKFRRLVPILKIPTVQSSYESKFLQLLSFYVQYCLIPAYLIT
jgi:hypothetical protein